MVGKTVGHYRILQPLGAGGMGIVYQAEDLLLGRQVALKFLPDHLAADAATLDRFRREARAASSINHPHICAIYDIGEDGGRPFLVMELLEGHTLSHHLSQGRVLTSDLLEWGLQITAALEAAHRKGVVHRDIKPANLFITSSRQAKVLDFGLAKTALVPLNSGEKTLSMALEFQTSPGMAVGTVGYMSPEQARGEDVDTRTDIFSFGVVLYEMATGRQPFRGDTPAVIFDAILNRTPESPRLLNPDTGTDLDQLICKALEKDRSQRYQAAADMGADLKRLMRKRSGILEATKTHTRHRRALMVGVMALLSLGIIGLGYALWTRQEKKADITLERLTANPSEIPVFPGLALSPDGKYLAYSDRNGIHVRLLTTGESRVLPDTKSLTPQYWSADTTYLMAVGEFRGKVPALFFRISLLGGIPQSVGTRLPSPDGRFVLYPNGSEIWAESTTGGPAHKVFDAFAETLVQGAWAPDWRMAATAVWKDTGSELSTVDVETGRKVTLLSEQPRFIGGTAWLSADRIVYAQNEPPPHSSDTNLWELKINRKTGAALGPPKRRTNWNGFGILHLTSSADGNTLCFLKTERGYDVFLIPLQNGGHAPARRLTLDDRNDVPSGWTPDSRAVLFASDRNGEFHIFKQDIHQETAELLVGEPGRQTQARLSPDGKWVLYVVSPETFGHMRNYSVRRLALADGATEEVFASTGLLTALQCSAIPGGVCIVNEINSNEKSIVLVDPFRGRGALVTRVPLAAGDADISADGKRIAYVSSEARNRIRILGLDGKQQNEITVRSAETLTSLRWTIDGRGFLCGEAHGRSSYLLKIDEQGNSSVLWTQAGEEQLFGSPSRDGRYVAARGVTHSGNVWKVEGL